jgi:translation initiation factor IF-2
LAKGHRIYKVAKELNIATDDVKDFLKERGIAIKSIMSSVDDEVYAEIIARFQTEKVSAERKAAFKRKKQKAQEIAHPSKKAPAQDITITCQETEPVAIGVKYHAEPVVVETPVDVEPEKPKAEKADKADKAEKVDKPVKRKKPIKRPALLEIAVSVESEETIITPIVIKPKPPKQKASKKHRKLSKAGLEASEKIREKKTHQPESEDDEQGKGKPSKSKRRRKQRKKKVDEAAVAASIKETLAKMGESTKKRKYKKDRVDETEEVDETILRVPEFTSAAELAEMMDVGANEVIAKCMGLGQMVSINQRLDMTLIEAVADEFEFIVEPIQEYGTDVLEETEIVDDPKDLKPRPPIVTIMGHVDHGKTSLLDHVRKSNVVAGEVGGITQSIGAYEVNYNDQMITFVDTPGHEAFTAMRARGAQLTDIVVLVVAADDNVMPQTLEAYSHAQAAQVPVIIAINKIDRPNANIDRIKQQLSEKNILIEEWGGQIPSVEISAKMGQNVESLLELVLLQAEMMELKANPTRNLRGVVVEAELDKGRGVVATVLVQHGTMRVGDTFVAGQYFGRVRALLNERGGKVEEAPPSTPIQVLGFNGTPQAGDVFMVMDSEREAREIANKRQQLRREQDFRRQKHITLDDISRTVHLGGVKELALVIKGDSDGSIEAICDSLMKIEHEEVKISIVLRGVGAISESDVLLAATSNSVILGFQVRPNIKARELAKAEQVDIRLYSVIYDAIAEVKSALEGMLSPDVKEEILGSAEVRDVFRITRVGVIAGCSVIEGRVHRSDMVRLIRDGVAIYEGKLSSLKRFKEDVREVTSGYECGIGIENYQDIKNDDIIEAYRRIEVAKTLV